MSEFDNTVPDIAGRDDAYTKACELARIQGRNRMSHQIVRSIIRDIDYSGTARDDEVYARLQEIHEENGLPYDMTVDELYGLYASNYGGSYE